MDPTGIVSRIQKREKKSSSSSSSNSNAPSSNRFKREYGWLFLIALFFILSLIGYIVNDKYNIVGGGVIGGGIGSDTTNKRSAVANKVGVAVVEEVDVREQQDKEDETTQIEIQTETAATAVAKDIDAEKKKKKKKKKNVGSNSNSNSVVIVVKDNNDDDESSSNTPVLPSTKNLSIIKQKQIENYRNGKALMVNVHMTHHGGTTFCGVIGRNGINGDTAPSFACMGKRDGDGVAKQSDEDWKYCHAYIGIPWPSSPEITQECINIIRPYFHMISWEFSKPGARPISDTNWENPELLSVIIMRDPISRLLAGDGKTTKQYPGYNNGNLNKIEMWKYVTDASGKNHNADNFFLKIFINNNTKYKNIVDKHNNDNDNGSRILRSKKNKNKNKNNNSTLATDPSNNKIDDKLPYEHHEITNPLQKEHYDRGVKLLNRFTYVLDIQCLNEGMVELAKQLNLNSNEIEERIKKNAAKSKSVKRIDTHSTSNRDRIGYDDVYEYLIEKNKWDIKLYEYSKTISIVNCSNVSDGYTGRYL